MRLPVCRIGRCTPLPAVDVGKAGGSAGIGLCCGHSARRGTQGGAAVRAAAGPPAEAAQYDIRRGGVAHGLSQKYCRTVDAVGKFWPCVACLDRDSIAVVGYLDRERNRSGVHLVEIGAEEEYRRVRPAV